MKHIPYNRCKLVPGITTNSVTTGISQLEREANYWERLNHFSTEKYNRAQKLHTFLFGGWVRGLSLDRTDRGKGRNKRSGFLIIE